MRYGWNRKMSMYGEGRSKQDRIGQQIYDTCEQMLASRVKMLCPLEVEDPHKEVFRFALTEKEWAAWEVLRHSANFSESIQTQKEIEVIDKAGNWHMDIPVDGNIPYIPVKMLDLPPAMQRVLWLWRVRLLSFQREQAYILEKIEELCLMCATPGQLQRVWPELLGFMPDDTKNKRFGAKSKSPLPDGVLEPVVTEEWKLLELNPEWEPEALEWMNDVFVEALLLPQWDKTTRFPALRDRN